MPNEFQQDNSFKQQSDYDSSISSVGNNNSRFKDLTREELECRVRTLEASNLQLKILLDKNMLKINRQENIKDKKKSKIFDFSKHDKRHILLKFCYLGWDRHGFAMQDTTKNTIETVLFDALLKLKLIASRETSNYHRCGRTDKGVSAFSQVISITVRSSINKEFVHEPNCNAALNSSIVEENELNYCKMLNRVLPIDIRVLCWSPAKENFSARFDCTSRSYKYFFPLADLDLQLMRKAAQYLIGEHDYRNFCKMDVGNGVVNFMRKINSININQIGLNDKQLTDTLAKRKDDSSEIFDSKCHGMIERGYSMCVATINGTAFLWHQIRSIMTILILVGEGKEEPDVVKKLLDTSAAPRKPQYGLASEVALNLYSTDYDNADWYYDHENLFHVISQFQKLWSHYAIKACMLRHMLLDLSNTFLENQQLKILNFPSLQNQQQLKNLNLPSLQARACLQEPKAKVYKHLLDRPTCESLDDRVKHYIKKQRLDENVLEKIKCKSSVTKTKEK